MGGAPEGSLAAFGVRRYAELVSSRRLELILMPTERCNFRCTYCYEDFSVGRMSGEVRQGVKALLSRRAGELDQLRLSWFGGEPLIADDVVLDVSGFAQELSRRHGGLDYRAGVTTNGYRLSAELARKLAAAGVLDYQISLDGLGAHHDRTRRRADGGPTFERIWANLLAIRATSLPIQVTLRLHFDRGTLPGLIDLIPLLRRELMPDSRFDFFFKPLERLGGPGAETVDPLSEREAATVVADLQRRLGSDRASTGPADPVCYAARPNSLLVRADGRIGKCTVALADDRNTVGRLGRDGRLAVDRSRLAPWLRGLRSLDPEALACPLAGLAER